jgi:hypothetical protein
VPQLLAKRREAIANPMRCRCAARLCRRIGRKVPLVLGDCTYEIGGEAIEHLAIPYKVIDRHGVILAARFTARCNGQQCVPGGATATLRPYAVLGPRSGYQFGRPR